jgi:putative hydrolase of the HAD superfamily
MNIQAVVFDLDDTLISEKQYVTSGFRVVSRFVSDRFGIDESAVFDTLHQLFAADSKRVFNRMFEELRIPYQEDDIRRLIELYRNHNPQIEFFDDVIPCLTYLRNHGVKTGVITDGYKVTQWKKLKAVSAEIWFDHIIVTDELGKDFWKPHPYPFELMAEKLGVQFNQMMYVGDNPEKDFYIRSVYPVITVRIVRDGSIYAKKPYYCGVKENFKIESMHELKGANFVGS